MLRRARSELTRFAAGEGRRAASFAFVGVFATIIDFLGFVAFEYFGAPLAPANIGGFLIANVFSYFANSALTFKRDGVRPTLSPAGYGKFLSAHLVGVTVSTIVLLLLAPRIGVLPAKGVAMIAGFASNYLLTARFVFTDKSYRSEV